MKDTCEKIADKRILFIWSAVNNDNRSTNISNLADEWNLFTQMLLNTNYEAFVESCSLLKAHHWSKARRKTNKFHSSGKLVTERRLHASQWYSQSCGRVLIDIVVVRISISFREAQKKTHKLDIKIKKLNTHCLTCHSYQKLVLIWFLANALRKLLRKPRIWSICTLAWGVMGSIWSLQLTYLKYDCTHSIESIPYLQFCHLNSDHKVKTT